MKKSILIVFIMLISHLSWGQDSQNDTILNGNWEYFSVSSETSDCVAPSPFPIKEFQFQEDKFIIVGYQENITGDYKFQENVIKMYNVFKDGKPQAQPKENKLTIKSINADQLIFELPVECGVLYVTLKRIS